MSCSFEDLKTAALSLPARDRAALARFLLQSLECDEEAWAGAWVEELDLRLGEFRSGQVVGVPAVEVLRRLKERYPADSGADAWRQVDAIHDRLAAEGRIFSDSADLLREDRDR